MSGTGPAINITGVAQLRRPDRRDRRLGLRLHAERDAGQQQHDAAARATTRSRPASTCSGSPTRAPRRRRSSTRSRTPRRTWRRATATNRLGYTSFTQYFGLPDLEYNTAQYGFFVQDDWRVTSDLKILYGVRYDLYGVPDGDRQRAGRDVARVPDSRATTSRRGSARCGRSARAGASVLRANTGMMYDQTLNAIYEQALQNDGTNARASADVHADPGRRAGVPGRAQRRRRRDAQHSRGRSIPTSRSRGRGRTTCSSSARSAITTRSRSARRT